MARDILMLTLALFATTICLLVFLSSEEVLGIKFGVIIFSLFVLCFLFFVLSIVMYKDESRCDQWNCSACGTANSYQTSCCAQCGTKKTVSEWQCECKRTNTGNYCTACGREKESDNHQWKCICGQWNEGNFCTACGKAKNSTWWTCDCGTQNSTEYCSNCGRKH